MYTSKLKIISLLIFFLEICIEKTENEKKWPQKPSNEFQIIITRGIKITSNEFLIAAPNSIYSFFQPIKLKRINQTQAESSTISNMFTKYLSFRSFTPNINADSTTRTLKHFGEFKGKENSYANAVLHLFANC